jgi:dTDP-4-dehydrorhamnose 3,5-epimerase
VKVIPTLLDGVLIIEPDVFADERGYFFETYNRRRYAEHTGFEVEFVQDNESFSVGGVLRGLHLQRTKPQGKLLRATTGHIWDVAVDVNPRSLTFRKWVSVDLTAENHRQIYIPPGFAHGFCVLSDSAHLAYKCTALYDREDEAGILWNDGDLGIEWPVADPRLSDRDRRNPSLDDFLRASP